MSKRYCKNVDIKNWETDVPWVKECISRHMGRRDFQKLLRTVGNLPRNYEMYPLVEQEELMKNAINLIAQKAALGIQNRELNLAPVRMKEKKDISSQKVRLIGCESAMQQVYDHIVAGASEEILNRRIVPQQASSIEGRGQIYGANIISKWICKDCRMVAYAQAHDLDYHRKCRYFVKLDAQKCFPNMKLDKFLEKFEKDCANEDVIWLWTELLKSHQVDEYTGFMIGALPSQEACQYMFSFIYRYTMDLYNVRRNSKIKLVSHMLIFMDDILIIGSNYKNLKMAVKKVVKFAREEFGIIIKPNWQICDIDKTSIDIMGYLIHKDGNITVRPRIFSRARRIFIRVLRKGSISYRQATRICSYKGYFITKKKYFHLCSEKIIKKYHLHKLFKSAARVVSIHDKKRRKQNDSTVLSRTNYDPLYAFI